MKHKYEMLKIFNCQDMPDDVREIFWDRTMYVSNDCYVAWNLEPSTYKDDEGVAHQNEDYTIVDDWLLMNGATTNDNKVLVSHWW